MASIQISPEHNIPKIIEILGLEPGGYRPAEYYRFEGGHLHVDGVTQEQLEEAWAIYNNNIEDYLLIPTRDHRKEELSRQTADYIAEKYPVFRQQMFQALYSEARANGWDNRAQYIGSLLDWIKSVAGMAIMKEEEVDAVGTVEEINGVVLDLSSFDASDPKITIKAAINISD